MRVLKQSYWLLLLVVSSLVAAHAVATSSFAYSLEELVSAADLVIVGTCVDAASEWREGSLATRYSFRVDERLKGASEDVVSVWVASGVDLKRAVPVSASIPGVPSFFADESAVLMLKRAVAVGAQDFGIVGFNQGSFPLRAESGNTAAPVARAGATAVPARGLRQFKARIAAIVQKLGGKPAPLSPLKAIGQP